MAKKSVFAQKLLDDLRLRKERIAASESSNRSEAMAIDAYAYSKHTHKGSRDVKALGTIGSRSIYKQNRSSGNNRLPVVEEASKQIVTYARGQSSEKMGDLSLALAFAFENGGIIRTDSSSNNPILGFLNQIGRKSMDFGKMEISSADRHRSSSRSFPTLSHLHIKEISKGAEKLNQILRACSGGLNFDRYSVEIGKELLKGAMDLEESLRMLVNLQEASEYIVSPQRKNRIILLEDDEDNEDNMVGVAEQQQLGWPKFSFDKPSRLKALTYGTEANNKNHEKQPLITSKSVSHKRSASYGPDIKTLAAFSEQKNPSSSSQSKPENGRISNVIAKLMGLDHLPEQADNKHTKQKDSTPRQKIEGMPVQRTTKGSTKNAVQKTKDTTNPEPPKRPKMTEAKRNLVTQDATYVSQGGKNMPTRNASFEATIHNRNPPRKDLEQTQPGTNSEKATVKNEKLRSNIGQLTQNTGNQNNIHDQMRKQHREQKGKVMRNTKESTSWEELHQMKAHGYNRSEAAETLQRETRYIESMIQPAKRSANKFLSSNQEKSQNSLQLQQLYILQKPEHQGDKDLGEESEQQSAKQKMQVSKQKASEMRSKSSSNTPHDVINWQKKHQHITQAASSKKSSTEAIHAEQSEGYPNGRHHEDLAAEESSTDLNFKRKALVDRRSDHNFSPKNSECEPGREKVHVPPVMEGKPVSVPATWTANSAKRRKNEIPRRLDEVVTRRNGTLHNFTRPLKHQNSILQEVKPRRNDKFSGYKGAEQLRANRSKEAESHIVKSNKSASSIQPLNVAHITKEAEQASFYYSSPEDGCQSLKELTLPPDDRGQNMMPKIRNGQQDQAPDFCEDEELNPCKLPSDELTGMVGDGTGISYHSELEHVGIPTSGMQEPLTESENCLKQTLIMSELFLNTAEALFKLNIPFDLLHASGTYYCRDEESKLISDCGYEVMKRKGSRQELIIHPCAKISISSIKAQSLDGLIKQLQKDFETLKFYGRIGNPNCSIEEYLPKMLESDIHDREPDVNSMWDSGWSEIMFALLEKDDVIRDVEKHVLNGLVAEITRDLLPI